MEAPDRAFALPGNDLTSRASGNCLPHSLVSIYAPLHDGMIGADA